MVDWLTWPAQLILSVGGIVASWFVTKDSLSFVALQRQSRTSPTRLMLALLIQRQQVWNECPEGRGGSIL